MTPHEQSTAPDDPSLLNEIRRGSTDALGELFTRHAQMVLAVAYRVTASREDAEDVLQDVFVMLPDALQRYREEGRFIPWLRRVAALTALMRVRSRSRRREAPESALEGIAAPAGRDAVAHLAAQRALAALPEPLRIVFVLKEIEGYSHAEIAEMVGTTQGNSAARLFRAWKHLRQTMEP